MIRVMDLGGYGVEFGLSLVGFDRLSYAVPFYVNQWVCGFIIRWVVVWSYSEARGVETMRVCLIMQLRELEAVSQSDVLFQGVVMWQIVPYMWLERLCTRCLVCVCSIRSVGSGATIRGICVDRVAGDGLAVVRRVAEEGEASSKHTRVNGVRREKLYGQPVCAKSLMLSYICIIIILFFWFTHS